VSRFKALEAFSVDLDPDDTDETGFDASQVRFGGKTGEVICAGVGLFAFGALIAHLSVALAPAISRMLWGQ
jgi:hypothetical protein